MQLPWKDGRLDEARVAWRATRHEGIEWCPVHEAPGAGPRETLAVIRMAPGRGYPPHEHLDSEDVLVLAGGYRDELGEHRAGQWLRYERGSRHSPVALGDPSRPSGPDNPACLLWAHARGGVRNLEVGESPQGGFPEAHDSGHGG
jgi:anti-sigma factor ChrR (cupin superfamily)